jgi:hypothetical protein
MACPTKYFVGSGSISFGLITNNGDGTCTVSTPGEIGSSDSFMIMEEKSVKEFYAPDSPTDVRTVEVAYAESVKYTFSFTTSDISQGIIDLAFSAGLTGEQRTYQVVLAGKSINDGRTFNVTMERVLLTSSSDFNIKDENREKASITISGTLMLACGCGNLLSIELIDAVVP